MKAGTVRGINLLLVTWTEWFFGRSSCQTTVSHRGRAEPSRRATGVIGSVRERRVNQCSITGKVLWAGVLWFPQCLSSRRAAAMLSRDFLAFFIGRSVVQMQNTDLVFVPIVCGEWGPPSLGCGGRHLAREAWWSRWEQLERPGSGGALCIDVRASNWEVFSSSDIMMWS